jgi:hypothetical protein
MTPIPPIPEDLREMYENAVKYLGLGPNGLHVREYTRVKMFIERIAKLTTEVERVIEERRLALNKVAGLEAENARLKAPVSDEELTPHCLGTKYFLTEVFDKVIASRATRTPPQEGQNANHGKD